MPQYSAAFSSSVRAPFTGSTSFLDEIDTDLLFDVLARFGDFVLLPAQGIRLAAKLGFARSELLLEGFPLSFEQWRSDRLRQRDLVAAFRANDVRLVDVVDHGTWALLRCQDHPSPGGDRRLIVTIVSA